MAQGNKGQGGKKQGGKKQAAKAQGGKKQGNKNAPPPVVKPPVTTPTPPPSASGGGQVVRNQGQGNKGQGNKQGGKKQGGKKQGGKKQGGKKQGNQGPTTDTTTSTTDPGKSALDSYVADKLDIPGFKGVAIPDTSALLELAVSESQLAALREFAATSQATEKAIAEADNKTKLGVANFNLQGTQAQAEATKFASTQEAGATKFASQQQAEATKFAATEQARGQIETQRIASESQEKQIGLTGEETRKTNLQSELFRRFQEAKDQLDALKAFKA